jgi:O-antigen/teichoic acid export membrane protein
MEQTNLTHGGLIRRLGLKALVVGAVGGVAGLGRFGPIGALGAVAGSLGACFYAWGYITSHLERLERERFFDSKLARSAVLRMVLIALLGAGMYALGRDALVAFLISFALAFLVLVGTEIPRMTQVLRARGVIGGR